MPFKTKAPPTAAALLLLYAPLCAQTSKSTQEKTMHQFEDRIALRELVDKFSILADQKDVHTQVQLFTPDAVLESFFQGKPSGSFRGRDAMEKAFGAYLANFHTVYHFNGQQVVTLNGDHATGVAYCTVTLIGNQNGKEIRTTMGVHYEDEFVRDKDHWLIAKREPYFDWQDRQELEK